MKHGGRYGIDPGELRHRVEHLEYGAGGWQSMRTLWCAREGAGQTVYAPHAARTEGDRFTMRFRGINPGHALRCEGQEYLVAEVDGDSPAAILVTAARVQFVDCIRRSPETNRANAYNRPTRTGTANAAFVGVLAEKYAGWAQETPGVALENAVLLITAKGVTLESGDLVAAGGRDYSVRACHLMDRWKNEYELVEERDA